MPVCEKGYSKVLKSMIFDLDERSCKQILYACVENLNHHPSILFTVFDEFIKDAVRYASYNKEVQKTLTP